jgi:hypothetical protein
MTASLLFARVAPNSDLNKMFSTCPEEDVVDDDVEEEVDDEDVDDEDVDDVDDVDDEVDVDDEEDSGDVLSSRHPAIVVAAMLIPSRVTTKFEP